ncbi:hypothetical protein Lalb_Chr08g0238241 [Lupinus albus]|uniref:Uncharacterized protein n=1 Tax=Lupinus albus TaxID=3870 RepID=A0A6A4Q4I3_LUPAL|nr:hypothetical protein Lalb_Chr08g0238241 [Lupinus albus]
MFTHLTKTQTMPHNHREHLARNLHIYSPISTPHIPHHHSEGDMEFSFWGSSNTTSFCEANEAVRLNKEADFAETYCFKFSDPSRRVEAIEEGRRELMEMVQNMHDESTYELSFQDMVIHDKHVLQQPYQNETSFDMHSSSNDNNNINKAQLKKQKKKSKNKSSNRPSHIVRVESMDSENFLLKMFFPTSLKKVKVEKSYSKVSPKPSSLEESVKEVGKGWRIKRYFRKGDNKGDNEDDMCGNNCSSNNNNKSRNFDRKFSYSSPSCWSFLHGTENYAKKLAR